MQLLSFLTALVIGMAIGIPHSANSWHENLGISDEQASQLYQTNPNDPQILQWKNSVQNILQNVDECSKFELDETSKYVCDLQIETAYKECITHPNALLGCINPRIIQYGQAGNSSNSTLNLTNMS
jgi:hypothetical protein